MIKTTYRSEPLSGQAPFNHSVDDSISFNRSVDDPSSSAAEHDPRTIDPCAVSRENAAYRKLTGDPHAVPDQHRAKRSFTLAERRRAHRRPLPKARRVIPAKANSRPAPARAVHLRVAHGGARKGDDRGGDGDGSPGSRRLACWTCGGLTEVGTMVADTDHIMCDGCQPFSDRDVIRLHDPERLRMRRRAIR